LQDVESFLAKPNVRVSGLAKKIALEEGIDLDKVSADGRIMASDLQKYTSGSSEQELEERQPMSRMRKTIAVRMRESRDISPDVAYDISVDMSAMKAVKADLASEGVKVSYTDLLVRIVSRLLLSFPLLNCSVDGDSLIIKRYANIGVAVALPEGLVVPVIKNAHKKGLVEISNEMNSLAESAKSGNLNPDDMSGGSFTITNLGMFGIESFTPIINQPEVAILGVNAISDNVVMVNGEIKTLPIMKLSLVADHRAVDGAVAAQFLSKLKQFLEKPATMLL
jgi:pyruvate dehydrogenase E2 component (dihydrolipoamide acetyltransferase)